MIPADSGGFQRSNVGSVLLEEPKQHRTASADFSKTQLALGDFAVFLVVEAVGSNPMGFRGISQSQITLTRLAPVNGLSGR
jgi:hypothetical protein